MNDRYTLHLGDCLDVMKELKSCSVDAIVTDPPYGLGFMGKHWDHGVPGVDFWAEMLRVLKPGGHLLAFSGSRTYHRMTCAIEDAGFDVRDQIAWVYSQGFPKSNNLDNLRGVKLCGCTTGALQYIRGKNRQTQDKAGNSQLHMHGMREEVSRSAFPVGEGEDSELQQAVQREAARGGMGAARTQGRGSAQDVHQTVRSCQPGMEGRSDDLHEEGELRQHPLRPRAGMGDADGSQGRLPDAAPSGDGELMRLPADADGSSSPPGPQPAEQRERQSGAMARQSQPQAAGAWPICAGCGLPVVPKGLGTALKPAHEPICVARKPLVGTVAENVLRFGTGAMNIDGARVRDGSETGGEKPAYEANNNNKVYGAGMGGGDWENTTGRWPANFIHDGSEEVSDLLADAARFFYCAKASKKDRGDGNAHPTVKPTDLMRYLCRLVTPPGGVILDPFMGSGSTGKAAMLEGFRFVGIEREEEYLEIAEARVLAGLRGYEAMISETATSSGQCEMQFGEVA